MLFKIHRNLILIISLFFLSCFLPSNLQAEFYKYKDKDGKIHFVDDMSKIPPEYRPKINAYKDKYDNLSEEEKKEKIEKEKEHAEKEAQEQRIQQEKLKQEQYEQSLKTKVIIRGNQVLVPVKLGYRRFEVETLLLLDTGASIIALHSEIAEKLYIKDAVKSHAQVVGGKIIDTYFTELKYVKVGPITKENIGACIIEHIGPPVAHNGLLGMNFLQGLDFDIDYENQFIRWKP